MIEALTVTIPEAKQEIASLRRKAEQANAWLSRAIDPATTVAELAAEIQAYSDRPPAIPNIAVLGEAIAWLSNVRVRELRSEASDRESGVREGAQNVQRQLYETGSAEIRREMDELRKKIQHLHGKINTRKSIIDAPEEMEKLRAAIEQLSREPRPDDRPYGRSPISYAFEYDSRPLTHRERYNVARQRLVELEELASGRDEALAANQRMKRRLRRCRRNIPSWDSGCFPIPGP